MRDDLITPVRVDSSATTSADLRVGHLLCQHYQDARVVIVGFPVDDGVRRNGGRPGAAAAPNGIRRKLYRLTADSRYPDHSKLLRQTIDLGDITTTGDLSADQESLGIVVENVLKDGKRCIIVGGGHETAFGHFLGYARQGKRVSIVNIDAHPDVRDLIGGEPHSGSPFRQALEHESGTAASYAVMGLQPYSVSAEHLNYLKDRNAHAVFRENYSADLLGDWLGAATSPVMATFDMDVVDSAFAPGVSAPAANGLSAEQFVDAMYLAGASPNVHSVDVVEVNPEFDIDDRTTRLAAAGIMEFIRGMSQQTYSNASD